MEESKAAVVLDNGSGVMKVGLAGNNLPTGTFPTLIGHPEKSGLLPSMGQKNDYVGLEAFLKKGVLDLKYPMEHGIVKNWEDMERIWHHAFYYILRVPPEEHALLLTEAPLNPRSNRELMAETMYETFYVPKLYVIIQPALALYSSGYTSGLVVDSGDGLTLSVPFFEGAAIIPAIQRLEVGGRDLTGYFSNLLSERGYSFSSSAGFEVIREAKEALTQLVDDEHGLNSPLLRHGIEDEAFTLPDGNTIVVGKERYRAGVDVRRYLYSNILLAGGATTTKGFVSRFQKSISSLLPSTITNTFVNAPHDRVYSVWIGGSILSSLSTFQQMFITRKEYDEVGSSVVSKKCL